MQNLSLAVSTMYLENPAIEFSRTSSYLSAKARFDHRWYRVRGITKTLATVRRYRKRSRNHNMIVMDIVCRILEDESSNSDNFPDWVLEHVKNLNVPESKAFKFTQDLQVHCMTQCITVESCRHLWDKHNLSTNIGKMVDSQCKDVFNGKKNISDVGPVSRLVLAQLKALLLSPLCAGLKVAGLPSPDMCVSPNGSYTYHNRCVRGCSSIRDTWGFYTEVDLVAYDTFANNVVLLELKTRNNDVLDSETLWRYNTQLWLTWIMFSLTYPSLAERSAAYLVIVRPGTNDVTIRSCARPNLSQQLRRKFPWLTCFCKQVLNCLTPTCHNMRTETTLTSVQKEACKPDMRDLCYRNILFNEEKHMKKKM